MLDLLLKSVRTRVPGDCPFCYDNVELITPQSKIRHAGLYTGFGEEIISFPNISPYMVDHHLTIFADHVTDLGELTGNDIVNYIASGHQLASNFDSQGAAGIVDFLNWGYEAGGSKRHPHAHRGKFVDMNHFYLQSKRAKNIQRLNGEGSAMMKELMESIREKDIFAFENEHIFVYAVWAPRYPNHVEVFFKKVGNVLDYCGPDAKEVPKDLRTAAESMLGIFHVLQSLGATDINMALHQSSFSGEPQDLIMQAEIFQRNDHSYGALEAAMLGYVIPTIPEKTAKAIRDHYARPYTKASSLNHHP